MPQKRTRLYNTLTLIQGDCLKAMSSIPDKSVDLVVTDPPYLFDNGNWYTSDKDGDKSILGKSSLSSSGYIKECGKFGEEQLKKFVSVVIPKMKKVNMYIFCSEKQVPLYGRIASENKLHFQILVWHKPLSIINKNRFSTNAEFIVRIYSFGTALNKLAESELYDRVITDKPVKAKLSPMQKPTSIVERFIKVSSKESEVILDPFMGSGTTGVACRRLGRKFIGIEKEQKYFDIAKRRICDEN